MLIFNFGNCQHDTFVIDSPLLWIKELWNILMPWSKMYTSPTHSKNIWLDLRNSWKRCLGVCSLEHVVALVEKSPFQNEKTLEEESTSDLVNNLVWKYPSMLSFWFHHYYWISIHDEYLKTRNLRKQVIYHSNSRHLCSD